MKLSACAPSCPLDACLAAACGAAGAVDWPVRLAGLQVELLFGFCEPFQIIYTVSVLVIHRFCCQNKRISEFLNDVHYSVAGHRHVYGTICSSRLDAYKKAYEHPWIFVPVHHDRRFVTVLFFIYP